MRKQFLKVLTRKQAEDRAPWAAEIVEAESGFWAFESVADALMLRFSIAGVDTRPLQLAIALQGQK